MRGPLFIPIALCTILIVAPGCWMRGSRVTQTVVEDRALSADEFADLFHEDRLYRACYWYYGSKDGYAFIEWDQARKDPIDNPISARVHHDLRRYRVADTQVVFHPTIAFEGYDERKLRIGRKEHFHDDRDAYYTLVEESVD